MQVGMGWIGWTEDQTLDTSMAAILEAYKGRVKLLQSIFGSGENESSSPIPDSSEVRLASPQKILSAFRAMKGT